ncbi:MAG: hypothetical protein U0271_13090 [Polyangiaceae bacterium]
MRTLSWGVAFAALVVGPGCLLDAEGKGGHGGSAGGAGGSTTAVGAGGEGGLCNEASDCPNDACTTYECGPTHTCLPQFEPEGTLCGSGHACDGAGHCWLVDGELCASPAECLSGICLEGVCCDTTCDGPCEVCEGGVGICSPATPGTDPDGDCSGDLCDGFGSCAAGAVKSAVSFGDDAGEVAVSGLALDSMDRAVLGGHYLGTVGALPAAVGIDGLVARLGTANFSQALSGNDGQHVSGVARGPADEIVAAGYFSDEIRASVPLSINTAGNDLNAFVARYDASGTPDLLLAFGDVQGEQRAEGVAVDAQGNLYVVGTLTGQIDFGGTIPAITSLAPTIPALFVMKLDSEGVPLWAKVFGDATLAQSATSVAVDAAGHVAIAGALRGTVTFGVGVSIAAGAHGAAFVAVLDAASGDAAWGSAATSTTADQIVHAIAFDAAGGVAVAGTLVGAVDFAGQSVDAGASSDAFAALFDDQGALKWVDLLGDANAPQEGRAIAASSAGIIFAGDQRGAPSIRGVSLSAAAGGTDAFVVRLFPADGTPIWVRSFGDSANQSVSGAAFTSTGDAAIAGVFSGALDTLSVGAETYAYVLTIGP